MHRVTVVELLNYARTMYLILSITFKIVGESYGKIFQLYPNKRYQSIHGFGGAATDSAGINWKALPNGAQEKLIE